jgi:hypothetical protein
MRPPTQNEIHYWATHPIAIKVNTVELNGETLTTTKWLRTPTPEGVDEVIEGSELVWHLHKTKASKNRNSFKLIAVTE